MARPNFEFNAILGTDVPTDIRKLIPDYKPTKVNLVYAVTATPTEDVAVMVSTEPPQLVISKGTSTEPQQSVPAPSDVGMSTELQLDTPTLTVCATTRAAAKKQEQLQQADDEATLQWSLHCQTYQTPPVWLT